VRRKITLVWISTGKVHPRTGHEGPIGKYRYSSNLCLTSVLDVVGGQSHVPAALPPAKTRYPLYRRLDGPQSRSGRVRRISLPPRFDPRTAPPVASRFSTELSRLPWISTGSVEQTSTQFTSCSQNEITKTPQIICPQNKFSVFNCIDINTYCSQHRNHLWFVRVLKSTFWKKWVRYWRNNSANEDDKFIQKLCWNIWCENTWQTCVWIKVILNCVSKICALARVMFRRRADLTTLWSCSQGKVVRVHVIKICEGI